MPKRPCRTADELVAEMLTRGSDCGIQLVGVQRYDSKEKVLVACFRNPKGPEDLLCAIHLLCDYWFLQGLAEAGAFADLLAQELEGQDPHH